MSPCAFAHLPQRQTRAAAATSADSHTQNSYPRTFTKCYPRAGTLLRKPDWATVDFTSNLEGEMPMVRLPSAIPTVSARSCSELQLGLLPGNQPPHACHACLRTIYVVQHAQSPQRSSRFMLCSSLQYKCAHLNDLGVLCARTLACGLMCSHGTDSGPVSLLRDIRPETVVTLDDIDYNVGGLLAETSSPLLT